MEHNPLAQPLPLLAEGTFRQVRFDADVGGGHQLVDRATVGHAVKLVALGVGEHTFECQFDVEGIFTFLLFAVVTFDFDGDTCLLYTSPSPRDATLSRMPSSA